VKFYLGAHQPNWLATAGVPLMVSHVRLAKRRTLPRAAAPWVLDSGAFSEIAANGQFTTSPKDYAAAVRRYAQEIGQLTWVAPQDWMCEPFMLKRTGLDVATHQARTIGSYLDLRAAGLPIIPVLQGWSLDDYRRHADTYTRAGIDLCAEPLVGLGSVCRRQATDTVVALVVALQPLRLHGFGMKTDGVARGSFGLHSADSMAWSYQARRNPGFADCPHRSCANCLRYALWWRQRILVRCHGSEQLMLEGIA
jgi:hypothetical protein